MGDGNTDARRRRRAGRRARRSATRTRSTAAPRHLGGARESRRREPGRQQVELGVLAIDSKGTSASRSWTWPSSTTANAWAKRRTRSRSRSSSPAPMSVADRRDPDPNALRTPPQPPRQSPYLPIKSDRLPTPRGAARDAGDVGSDVAEMWGHAWGRRGFRCGGHRKLGVASGTRLRERRRFGGEAGGAREQEIAPLIQRAVHRREVARALRSSWQLVAHAEHVALRRARPQSRAPN